MPPTVTAASRGDDAHVVLTAKLQENRIMDDALQFIQFYNVNSFPYVAIIDPRTGENMAQWNNLTMRGFLTAGEQGRCRSRAE